MSTKEHNQPPSTRLYLAQIDYIINDNYYLDGTISAQWHITPKLLTVSWTTGSYTYNASLRGITLTISGIIPDDSIIVNVTTTGIYPSWGESQLVYDGGNGELKQTFGAVAVGSYTAEAISLDAYNNGSENYALPANEGSWTINKAVISIVWSQKASNSGVYDGFSQGVEAAITGIVPNETVAFIFPAASNTYEYTDISMTAAVNGVYDFTSINSELRRQHIGH